MISPANCFDKLQSVVKPQPLHATDRSAVIRQLLSAILQKDTTDLYTHWHLNTVSLAQFETLSNVLNRFNRGEPLQYLTGKQWFWNSEYSVGPGVLIPRPETELLVEKILENLPNTPIRIAELGAGTGNIGISVIQERPSVSWHAWEHCSLAASFAKKNLVNILGDFQNYALRTGDFFAESPSLGPWDAIVSNPPYVASHSISSLSQQVQSEPKLALDGGSDGLSIIRRIIEMAADSLKPGGLLALEIGEDQRLEVLKILNARSFMNFKFADDLNGKPRVVTAIRN